MKSVIAKLKQEAHWESLGFRRALRSALVVLVSVILYQALSLTQGYWVTLTAVIVVQATVGATLRKSFQRFLGTLLGVIIASLLLFWIQNKYIIDILVLLFLFLAYFFNPFTNLINYGLVVVPMSISVMFLLALITPGEISSGIIYARFYDTVIGAVLGIVGALFLFPNKVKHEFETSKEYLEKQMLDYFTAILDMFLNIPGSHEQAKAKKMLVEEALLTDRQFYLERVYEMHFNFSRHKLEKNFLEVSERMAQRLFSLHHIARYSHEMLPEEILLKIKNSGFDVKDEVLSALKNYIQDHTVALASLYFTVKHLREEIRQVKYVR